MVSRFLDLILHSLCLMVLLMSSSSHFPPNPTLSVEVKFSRASSRDKEMEMQDVGFPHEIIVCLPALLFICVVMGERRKEKTRQTSLHAV